MSTLERAQSALAGLEFQHSLSREGTPVIELAPALAWEAIRRLKQQAGFDTNTFVTAVDHFPAEPRFELVWQFLSSAHADRVRLRARIDGGDPRVRTITDLFPGAAYSERECWDMFGIRFDGHVGLKRLLMPQAYEHHPLRKDFPHQGIEPDRLYREWDRLRRERPVNRDLPHAPQGN
ncbi:MAG: NADH-quinone oxidoreductase subunit C [Planctomycetes bacterium]|nr:NADH-quinone oxidoreductase subunit C [Planctomycetota bacterium]